jgi:hypothetical protein
MDEQQAQDIEAIAFARREACSDVVAALEARVAHMEAVFASPGWAALAAWFAERPENRVRELEARLARVAEERDKAMNECIDGAQKRRGLEAENARLTEALAAAEARLISEGAADD